MTQQKLNKKYHQLNQTWSNSKNKTIRNSLKHYREYINKYKYNDDMGLMFSLFSGHSFDRFNTVVLQSELI